jgi:hypothetical protein
MWYLQARIDTPNETQQPGQKGGSRMKTILQKTVVSFMANASTSYYVNNLPPVGI